MAILGDGDFPFNSSWFRSKTGGSRNNLLRKSPTFDPAVRTIFGEFFFDPLIQLVGFASGTSLDSDITLSLTSLTGGIGTAPAQNDIVILVHYCRATGDFDVGASTAGYTEVADLYSTDTGSDANLSVSWKRMGSTPDTSVTTLVGSGRTIAVAYVLRGVDTTTALDVAATTATGNNSGISNPPAITSSTPGSRIVAIAAAMSSTATLISQPDGYGDAVNLTTGPVNPRAHLSVSSKIWAAGTEDPAPVTGVSDSTSFAWAAITLAFRPQQPPAITGSASITEGDDTVTATGTVRVAGSAAITEEDDTVAATGTVGSAPITGSASITEADDTVSGTGTVRVAGAASITEGDDTVAATGNVRVAGSAAVTEGNDTVTATGTVRVAGTGSVIEADDAVAATGVVRIAGAASIVEANDTIVATGTVTGEVVEPPPPAPITGGGDSSTKDDWWRSPPGKKKRRKAQTTDTGAPTEAPLAVSDDAQRLADELDQAARRDAAAAATIRELERQRLEALIEEDELVLLLAA